MECPTTLKRHAFRDSVEGSTCTFKPGQKPALTMEEEPKVVEYILHMSEAGFILSVTDVRKKAYELVEASGRKNLFSSTQQADSYHWWKSYKSWNELSLRTPKSLANYRRSTSCNNRTALQSFFSKLEKLYERCDIS